MTPEAVAARQLELKELINRCNACLSGRKPRAMGRREARGQRLAAYVELNNLIIDHGDLDHVRPKWVMTWPDPLLGSGSAR